MVSELNGWDKKRRAIHLATSLSGQAATTLASLPHQKRTDYDALVMALNSRFGVAHQTELARVQFRNRKRLKDEALPELACDIERLVQQAYPEASSVMHETLAIDQFIDALVDEDMRLRLRQSKANTLQEALKLALELESFVSGQQTKEQGGSSERDKDRCRQ